MEPEWIVFVASAIGTLVSGALLVDAVVDRRIVKERLVNDKALEGYAQHRVVSESLRLATLIGFVYISVAVILDHQGLEQAALWVLVVIPFLITASSLNSWFHRHKKTPTH